MLRLLLGLLAASATAASAAETPASCPSTPVRIVRSAGGTTDYLGTVAGIADLCRMARQDGVADYYMGVWRSDWPGAGDAYPALVAVLHGPPGTRASFVTRSVPGYQFHDSFINGGIETMVVAGRSYRVLKLAHERQGFDGNFYHSIITSWRDVATGANLRTKEDQIAGDSYGPDTTWTATAVETPPPAPRPPGPAR